jgi:adenine-specific DNA-methyltransferase
MAAAMADLIGNARASVLLVSYNDEAWVTPDAMIGWLREAGHQRVELLAFDSRRYIGAQIGIYNPQGERVGRVTHTRNTEYVFVAGEADRVEAAVRAAGPFIV